MKKLLAFSSALIALTLVLLPTLAQAQRGFVVIVHSSNPSDSLSKDQISDFLLKKKSKWEDGTQVNPADLDSQSPVRAAMSREVHGRSVASIKNYWQRQIFSGRDVPPPEVGSDAEMIAHVSRYPGSIGYVSPGANLNGVKSVRVVD